MQQIKLSEYFMGRQRQWPTTAQQEANANRLLEVVNNFLFATGWAGGRVVSSGYRPAEVNAKVPNAAKASLHTQCLAIDILDDKAQSLAAHCRKHAAERHKLGLWLECPENTRGVHTNWVHLDLGQRAIRASMEFKP